MSGLENAAWQYLRPFLQGGGLDPVRIENLVSTGVPDVNYSLGWIELKAVSRWPVKGGPLLIPHFTAQQRVWLDRRWVAGGLVWLLLRVKTDKTTGPAGLWMLFDGWTASRRVGRSTREEMWGLAAWRGEHLVEMLPWLRGEPNEMGGRAMLMRLQCRRSRAEVASDFGWSPDRVEAAERGLNDRDALTLLDYWNS